MKILDLTFPTPDQNLACDATLLDQCEQNGAEEALRFWAPENYFVVLGYSNKPEEEAHLHFCEKNKIPVLRRISGGGTILQGPGCLNYSLILKIKNHAGLESVTSTNRFVMQKHAKALSGLLKQAVEVSGHTDLTLNRLKFSGNAQRRKRNAVLFHGTFLLQFDMTLIEKTLKIPPKQPAYRNNRPHREFLMNLDMPQEMIKKTLEGIWL